VSAKIQHEDIVTFRLLFSSIVIAH